MNSHSGILGRVISFYKKYTLIVKFLLHVLIMYFMALVQVSKR